MNFSIKEIINSPLFQKTVNKVFNKKELVTIKRPGCFFIREKIEDKINVKRIILLPPKGFTGNKKDLLNPHPEARVAKIYLFGKINPTKKGFKPLVKEIDFHFSLKRNPSTESNSPYIRYTKKSCGSQIKSWRNWFYVVKENGWGNFHSLVNSSNDWVVAVLEKKLVDHKKINLNPYLKQMSKNNATRLKRYLDKILKLGDAVFKQPKIVRNILKTPPRILVPILVRMLNVPETGRHEPCTFFGLILKIAKDKPDLVKKEVGIAISQKTAPYYYLNDLRKKLLKT